MTRLRCRAAHTRARRGRPATTRCRSRDRSVAASTAWTTAAAIDRIAEQTDVAAKGSINPLAVGDRRLGRIGVLAMTSEGWLAAMRFPLPEHLAGHGIERDDQVANALGLVGRLDVTRKYPLHRVIAREALRHEPGHLIVAEDSVRRFPEAALAHCRRHEQPPAPQDGRRPASSGNLLHPGHVLGGGPLLAAAHVVRRHRTLQGHGIAASWQSQSPAIARVIMTPPSTMATAASRSRIRRRDTSGHHVGRSKS